VASIGRARSTVLLVVGILALVMGLGSMIGGIAGAIYTYDQAVAENITTPDDASIPEAAVRGPFTMLSQADIILEHQLESTEGLRYAEMPRQVEQLDDTGNVVIGEDGNPVMVANAARATWVTATALRTALQLGVLAYALAAFAFVTGLTLAGCGVVFLALRKPDEVVEAT